MICGVVSTSGRLGEPLACGFRKGHDGAHSWASLPTFVNGVSLDCIVAAANHLESLGVAGDDANAHWANAAECLRRDAREGRIERELVPENDGKAA